MKRVSIAPVSFLVVSTPGIATARAQLLVAGNAYARVPRKRPKLCARSIRERDGNRCQYTGRVLQPEEGSLDHVVPRSRGGANSWENLVWSSKEVNARKGNCLPQEAGLKLLATPRTPKELPATAAIREIIDTGYHREALLHLLLVRTAAQGIIENNADKEAQSSSRIGYQRLLVALGIDGDEAFQARGEALRAFMPVLRDCCKALLAQTPGLLD